MTNTDYHPTNKANLLETIHRERNHLEALINGFSEIQMVQSGVEANWSIKDILAHISAWERLANDRIHAALTGEPVKFPVISGETFVDEFNANVYHDNKDKELPDIQSEFRNSHSEFVSQIQKLDDQTLESKLPFDWAGNMTFQVMISANTHWHYLEHAESIKKWLKSEI